MENNLRKKYSIVSQILIMFAVDILFLSVIAYVSGDDAQAISTMFQFGSKGLALSTIFQFLLSSIAIILFKTLFFSEKIFRSMMTLWRTILLLLSILITMTIFIRVFNWFPLRNLQAWGGFFICFGGGFIASSGFMVLKTKLDNKKYDRLLSAYKNQHGGGTDE